MPAFASLRALQNVILHLRLNRPTSHSSSTAAKCCFIMMDSQISSPKTTSSTIQDWALSNPWYRFYSSAAMAAFSALVIPKILNEVTGQLKIIPSSFTPI